MKKAKISEIFSSIQGEGVYLGVPQLFIRFFGCNLSCCFCDTSFESFGRYSTDELIKRAMESEGPHHSVSLTGGEPLLQSDFISEFLPEYKERKKIPVYLETNGTLPSELFKIIDLVDIIAMDFKLPSSTNGASFWDEHERFLKIATTKDVFVKAIITSNTEAGDISRLSGIMAKVGKDIPLVLQPVTVPAGAGWGRKENPEEFMAVAQRFLSRVEIIPQVHKLIGVI